MDLPRGTHLRTSLLTFAGMVQDELDGDGKDYMELLPNFEFDNGLDSPHLYVHGVPFHSMVDEEIRERRMRSNA